jgi:hypothetical protein
MKLEYANFINPSSLTDWFTKNPNCKIISITEISNINLTSQTYFTVFYYIKKKGDKK